MNELAAYQQSGLPAQPVDLVKFIVIAQEKAKALRAEIHAIEKLELAKEVYDQKLQEQARLNELVIIAKNRVGDFLKEIPRDNSFRGNQHIEPTSHQREVSKTKKDVIEGLGLSSSQANRFEAMASRPDIVEEVIAESRAGLTDATQGEVLRRIKESENVIDIVDIRDNRFKQDMKQIDVDYKNLKQFRKAVSYAELYAITDEVLDSVIETDSDPTQTIRDLDTAIGLLTTMKNQLAIRRAKHGQGKSGYT